ncbi:hypothetical protein [Leptothrix discophora]|uniref:Transposase n=1 Tax=Leptothrix discophora TaxID=89 RepID=A0ABT9G857_LEPDI|nr:hypothetical protein [Leptothrix discophora]MDP4302683.1 hypothetical protein [Leptothrix discophora]
MELHPTRPPGRATRKALAYAAEIQRLHGAGHSLEAIRLALGSVGVVVGRSTVYREVVRVRGASSPPVAALLARPMSPVTSTAVGPVRALPSGLSSDTRSGQAIAEAFMKSRITNPLLQERNPP